MENLTISNFFINRVLKNNFFEFQSGTKRNSSQGKTASKSSKPNTIHMSLSLREEVKLNQTENAWVPTAVKKASKSDSSKNKNEEELKTEVSKIFIIPCHILMLRKCS